MRICVVDGRLLQLLKDNVKEGSKYYSKPVINLFSNVCLADLDSERYQSYMEYDCEEYNVVRVYRKFYCRLCDYLKYFSLRDRLMLEWRYGFRIERSLSYTEISKLIGISASTVSKIECKSLDKLRKICVYYKVGDCFLDSEEYADYKRCKARVEEGRFNEINLWDVINEYMVIRSLSSFCGVRNMDQLRNFIFSSISSDYISESDIVELFCTLHGVGPLKATSAVESIKMAGLLDFLTNREESKGKDTIGKS